MSKSVLTTIALLGLCLSGCTMNDSGAHFTGLSAGDAAPPGSYCYENPALCVVGGVVVVGVAAGIIANSQSHSNNQAVVAASDSRVKEGVRLLTVLDNGLRLYTYHYVGDDRLFSGVLAQDLLGNPGFAKAVSRGADGYYRVDYAKLGLTLFNGKVMGEAGEMAVSRANHAR